MPPYDNIAIIQLPCICCTICRHCRWMEYWILYTLYTGMHLISDGMWGHHPPQPPQFSTSNKVKNRYNVNFYRIFRSQLKCVLSHCCYSWSVSHLAGWVVGDDHTSFIFHSLRSHGIGALPPSMRHLCMYKAAAMQSSNDYKAFSGTCIVQ